MSLLSTGVAIIINSVWNRPRKLIPQYGLGEYGTASTVSSVRHMTVLAHRFQRGGQGTINAFHHHIAMSVFACTEKRNKGPYFQISNLQFTIYEDSTCIHTGRAVESILVEPDAEMPVPQLY